ncbi:Thymidylate kinase (Tmk) (PDB:3LV8) [Commensalibacter communis]|uniref:Thymidylate kinase (Tmk) n=1 Tax=Commensalibacter communis TaxID=2972786 RepID=A0A9W4TQB6_9PROT|nr:nucleoside triphosphate hydrolase [Commensalibacter communis]CAI3949136.1 Thymidylate kinase (Tmk) (PDB:3LV8) [Commensalibacter communis]CAI3949240.1 Thymidylate kinase (Tmk) (PDB:3LV8) [Commensalibacter communis]CAI3949745.1 Thymidylate kinase (Tmk) (PDB:3LV8) [Commensalibacter communis]CAI3955633.1 Thymidylate kinase (Tmk) (PDB:3LV8) [Commensalibacter communis]CAI3957135.1 Thymidylate kinase (Tmk) (PDB:3LV8) [Commensalibacter communis]
MKQNVNLPIIAIIGADGSGKSTICSELMTWLEGRYPVRLCHLGRQTGNIGRMIAKLPFLGKKLDHKIAGKANKARSDKGPKAGVACIMFLLSLKRVYRFYKMLRLKKQGFLIITDRYPQISVIGGLDGPDLTIDHPDNIISRWLTQWERRLYRWMADHKPDLVIRLNVDIDTAMKRKPDHRLSSMVKKIESIEKLTFNGAPIIDLYSHKQPLEEIIQEAKNAIREVLIKKP